MTGVGKCGRIDWDGSRWRCPVWGRNGARKYSNAVGSIVWCEVTGGMYGFRLCVNACKVCGGVCGVGGCKVKNAINGDGSVGKMLAAQV